MNVNEVNKIKWSEDYSFLFFFFFSIATQKGNFSSSEDGKRSIYSFRALRPFDVASSFLEFWKTGTRLRHSIFPPPLLLLLLLLLSFSIRSSRCSQRIVNGGVVNRNYARVLVIWTINENLYPQRPEDRWLSFLSNRLITFQFRFETRQSKLNAIISILIRPIVPTIFQHLVSFNSIFQYARSIFYKKTFIFWCFVVSCLQYIRSSILN